MQRRKQPPSMLELCEIIKRRREQMWGPMDDDTDEGNSSFRRTERTSSGQQQLTVTANDQPATARQLVLVMTNQRSGSSGYGSDSRVASVIAVSKLRRSFIEYDMEYESTSVDVNQPFTASQSEFQQFQMTEADGGYDDEVLENVKCLIPQYTDSRGKRNLEVGFMRQRKSPDATHDDHNGKKKIVAVEGWSSAPQRKQTGRKVKSSENAIQPPLIQQPAVNGVASSHPPIWRAASSHRPIWRGGVNTMESLHPDHPEQHESHSLNRGRRLARQEICRETASPRTRRIGIQENNENDRAERIFLRVLSKRF